MEGWHRKDERREGTAEKDEREVRERERRTRGGEGKGENKTRDPKWNGGMGEKGK